MSVLAPMTSSFLSLANPRPYSALASFGSNRSAPFAKLQVGQSTRIERGGSIRVQPKSLIAIRQGCLQFAEYGATPTASVPCCFQTRVQSDRFVIIAGRMVVLPLALISLRAVRKSVGIVGIELDGLVEVFDRTVMLAFFLVSHA